MFLCTYIYVAAVKPQQQGQLIQFMDYEEKNEHGLVSLTDLPCTPDIRVVNMIL